MSTGLSASRMSLEAERKRKVAQIEGIDTTIAEEETRLGQLRSQRDLLRASVDELTVGIDALREVERSGQEA
jgi:hypothetical protein